MISDALPSILSVSTKQGHTVPCQAIMPSAVYSTFFARIRKFRDQILFPDRRRNPLLRILCRLLALALLVGVLGIGMLLCLVLLMVASIQRLFRKDTPGQAGADGQVMDGEYRVVKSGAGRPPLA